jgi:hypothetical protein
VNVNILRPKIESLQMDFDKHDGDFLKNVFKVFY